VALALVSSALEKSMTDNTAVCGEIGLSGEVRPVLRLESRLKEASRLGLKKAIIPAPGAGKIPEIPGMEIITVETVEDAVQASFS
jgi:DNA repair protein RadA/Sms